MSARIFRPVLGGLMALVLAGTMAACGSTDDVGPSTSQGGKKDIKEVKIGFLQRQMDAPFYTAMVTNAKARADKDGFELQVQDAGGDPVKQLDQAQTMQAQGVDVMVIDAISPETQRQQLAGVAKSTPVVFVDTGISNVGVTSVTSNNSEIGKLSGKLTAERFGSGTEISMAILNGGANDELVGPARQQGFLDGLTEGGVKYDIVAEAPAMWAQDKAVPASESMLAAHPDVDLVLGLNDAMALGALTVLRDQNNTKTLVAASSDGQKEALKEIKDGGCEGQYVSTGLNSPDLAGARAMDVAVQLATGEATKDQFKPEEFTKSAGINCKNIDEYYNPDSEF